MGEPRLQGPGPVCVCVGSRAQRRGRRGPAAAAAPQPPRGTAASRVAAAPARAENVRCGGRAAGDGLGEGGGVGSGGLAFGGGLRPRGLSAGAGARALAGSPQSVPPSLWLGGAAGAHGNRVVCRGTVLWEGLRGLCR